MKKIIFVFLVLVSFYGCSEIGVVREKLCENKDKIKQAIDILCITISATEQKALEDSINVWMGLKK